MLVAIIMLFSFIGERIELWAAILGGAGFGTFIDEVGKFVTSDNNYFFEPSVSIMYIVFVLIVLSIHMIRTGWTFTEKEFLVNALKGLEEIALRDLDEDEKSKVMRYLGKSSPGNPLTKAVRDIVTNTALIPAPEPGLYTRVKKAFKYYYQKVVGYRYFKTAVVALFLIQLVINLY